MFRYLSYQLVLSLPWMCALTKRRSLFFQNIEGLVNERWQLLCLSTRIQINHQHYTKRIFTCISRVERFVSQMEMICLNWSDSPRPSADSFNICTLINNFYFTLLPIINPLFFKPIAIVSSFEKCPFLIH